MTQAEPFDDPNYWFSVEINGGFYRIRSFSGEVILPTEYMRPMLEVLAEANQSLERSGLPVSLPRRLT